VSSRGERWRVTLTLLSWHQFVPENGALMDRSPLNTVTMAMKFQGGSSEGTNEQQKCPYKREEKRGKRKNNREEE
jgi:hypothetical protein